MTIIKKISKIIICLSVLSSCNQSTQNDMASNQIKNTKSETTEIEFDKRISLQLNSKQKNHQLINMRDHLEAIQSIITLLATENYDEASEIASLKLGSTTKMKLMCASFGDKNFENLGLQFHKSADLMSETFKSKNKEKSLEALSNTMNYCVQCHATYRQ